ncbi:MAG: cysteine synthase A [candidate division Zixibacteria bacterium]|nr:cysteine synthase A [candidate division Zixibacteria bacterium]
MLFNNIVDAIGHTPLVKLNNLNAENSATIYLKMESFNPCSSGKDRIGAAMISAAEKAGLLQKGVTIVEPTSGNTGIALAMVAAAKGYKCILTMPDTMSLERRALLKFLGAEIVLTSGSDGMKGAIAKAEEISSQPDYFMPLQFENKANPEIHKKTTGPEIVNDLGDINLDAFVSGVGTGGTISGAGRVLKDKFGCKIIAVEPESSAVLSGGTPGAHPIQGIGAGFIPKNYNSDVVDEIIQVKAEDSILTAKELAKKDGIVAGISSGANVWAALQVAKELGPDKTVVTVICDTGERYLSTMLFE